MAQHVIKSWLYNGDVLLGNVVDTRNGALYYDDVAGKFYFAVSDANGNELLILLASGGAGAQTEVDFGATPTLTGTFTISDAAVQVGSKIVAAQSADAATGREADENDMDPLDVAAGIATAGGFTIYAKAGNGPVVGKFKINYLVV